MENRSKIFLDKYTFENILSELRALSIICLDDAVKIRLQEVLKNLDRINSVQNKLSVEEIISKALEETKRSDSDLNAKLYILYQDLKRGKISEEEALEVYERHVRNRHFDTMIY